MQIQHADPTRDAAACLEIYAPFILHGAVSFEERAPSVTQFAQRIARVSRRHPWLVARERDLLAGFAYASPHRERAAYRWSCETSVYVHPAWRRRGVGRALYEALLQLLSRQGMAMALAGVTLPNPASVALHESMGFERVGVYRRIGFKAGAWHDVGWWQRPLADLGDAEPPEPGPPARLEG